VVAEVRAQFQMLEQLKHQHSLPPSPPTTPPAKGRGLYSFT